MDIYHQITERIKTLTAAIGQAEPSPVASVAENIELCINQHNTFLETVKLLNPDQRKQLTDMINAAMLPNQPQGQWLKLYADLLKGVSPKVRQEEAKVSFSMLVEANSQFLHMLNTLAGKIKELFPNPDISIQNLNVTQTMVLGFMEAAEAFSGCSIAIWNGMLEELLKTPPNPAKYLYNRVTEELPTMIALLMACCDSGEVASFDQVMTKLKKENLDTFLLNKDNTPNTAFLHQSFGHRSVAMFMTRGLIRFNPVVWVQRYWAIRRRLKIGKMEQEANWLRTQVDLLKLKMQGIDPNSQAYRNLEHAIERYNAIVARLEADVERYHKG